MEVGLPLAAKSGPITSSIKKSTSLKYPKMLVKPRKITLLVDDADGVVERAVAAGARVTMPVQDMFWGGHYGKIVDPFGHEWGINQQVKEQSHEETQTAADEFFAKQK
jgi:hypothetical protein